MAFAKKTWKDRLVEYAGRRTLKRVSGDPNGTMVVDVTRSEGLVSQAGDAFSAENMNDLEERIAKEFQLLNTDLVGKQEEITGAASSIASSNLTASRALVSNSLGKVAVSAVTSTELGYLDGVTSNVQTQLTGKQNKLLYNTYTSKNTANANGIITLGINISSLGLSQKPSAAFLQGQNAGFYSIENYVYAYDQSNATLAVFVVNYGPSAANAIIEDRYGFVVFP